MTAPVDPILIVDDDPTCCEIMADTLQRAGYRVEAATDPTTAFVRAQHRQFALVVSDVSMPVVRGTTLAAALRHARPDIPVLLVSAFPDAAVRAQARALGIPVLAKPFTPASMVALVEQLLHANAHDNGAA